jgi:4-oxalocrotonate tautomerase
MPIITIQILEGRPKEKIRSLIAHVTETVAAELGSPKDRIRVIVAEIPKSHWGVGGTPISEAENR